MPTPRCAFVPVANEQLGALDVPPRNHAFGAAARTALAHAVQVQNDIASDNAHPAGRGVFGFKAGTAEDDAVRGDNWAELGTRRDGFSQGVGGGAFAGGGAGVGH